MRFGNRRDSNSTRLDWIAGGYNSGPDHSHGSLALETETQVLSPVGKVDLTRIRPEKNERRFYCLEIQCDLFGTIVLCRSWGRIGRAGKVRFDPHVSIEAASKALGQLCGLKRRRGYHDRAPS
jgi:predicted DNA-binding WGR domain protein